MSVGMEKHIKEYMLKRHLAVPQLCHTRGAQPETRGVFRSSIKGELGVIYESLIYS